MSNGNIKMANQKFTSIKNDYAIIFDQAAEIEKCEDDRDIEVQSFSFVSLQDVSEFAQYRSVDIIGVIKELNQPATIKIKARNDMSSQTEKDKRTLTIVDDSNFSIQVTLWGFHAHND